jgi:hypothetical protein
MKVAVARTRARTRACARWIAVCACAHTYANTRTHCHVHTYAHMYPVVHVWCGRAHDPPDHASAHRQGRVSTATGALTVSSTSATRPPPAAPRARCCPRTCAPTVRPRRAAPAEHARGLDRGRRPATPPPPHQTPRSAAPAPGAGARAQQRKHRRERTRRRRVGADAQFLQELALAERLGERLHLRGEDGSAAHRARVRPRPPRDNGWTWGRTGRTHGKSPRMP